MRTAPRSSTLSIDTEETVFPSKRPPAMIRRFSHEVEAAHAGMLVLLSCQVVSFWDPDGIGQVRINNEPSLRGGSGAAAVRINCPILAARPPWTDPENCGKPSGLASIFCDNSRSVSAHPDCRNAEKSMLAISQRKTTRTFDVFRSLSLFIGDFAVLGRVLLGFREYWVEGAFCWNRPKHQAARHRSELSSPGSYQSNPVRD